MGSRCVQGARPHVRAHSLCQLTHVYCVCAVRAGWVNGFVAQQGLPRAVAWVKKEAESRAPAEVVSDQVVPDLPTAAAPPPIFAAFAKCLCLAKCLPVQE